MATSLAQKLQLKPDQKLVLLNVPKGYLEKLRRALADNPLTTRSSGRADAILVFVNSLAEAQRLAPKVIKVVNLAGLLWIAYPKGSAKIKADLNRDSLWRTLEPAGWQGVRLIALDETWSAMRFRPAKKVGQ